MARFPITGKAYQERSLIASAQKTINLYAELNTADAQAPVPITYYPTPGFGLFGTPNLAASARCSYRTSLGTAYYVVGSTVYNVAINGALVVIGSIPDRQSQVYMADNGLAAVLIDGTGIGYAIDLVSNAFAPIIDPSFYGADFVVFLDTFFVFNRPATNQFYISLSQVNYALLTAGTSFDPLDIAAKSGSADPIVAITTTHKELWLIGALTTEVWIGTGAADFYFQLVQGAYIDHGCIAPYTAATIDILSFWLMRDRQGKNIIVQGSNYQVKEISTPFLVNAFDTYIAVSDAIGFCFQIAGHAFYCITFPQANKTWLYDLKLEMWSEWNWYNSVDGSLNRHRANCCMFAFDKVLIGDWENGKIYYLDANLYTDNGDTIVRIKTFAHIVGNDFERIIYNNFDADMEVGTSEQLLETDPDPVVFLSWSDDRGKSYGFPVDQSLGREGEYFTTISWNRLGYARDRVFKLQWSAPIQTALNGGFIDIKKAKT